MDLFNINLFKIKKVKEIIDEKEKKTKHDERREEPFLIKNVRKRSKKMC